ncbi:MAG: hypothetical protein IIB71_14935 [Proteobacteria bacterium]|nr:hypothetical protein [Pseudomonadota bacterium]
MTDFFSGYEYPVAWAVYCASGVGCCVVWWKITSFISHRGWRELLRGIVIVVIFTPWYAGESPEFYAPAIVVLLMDLLLEGAKAGMKGGIALLFSSFVMLLVLTARLIRRNPGTAEGTGRESS